MGGLHVFGGESTTFGRCVMCLTGNTLVHGFAMRHFRHSFSKKSATFLIQINPVSDTMTPVAGCADETRTNNKTNAKNSLEAEDTCNLRLALSKATTIFNAYSYPKARSQDEVCCPRLPCRLRRCLCPRQAGLGLHFGLVGLQGRTWCPGSCKFLTK